MGVKVVMVWGIGCVFWLVVRFLGNNAPAALHAVGGRQGRLRRLHAFLFCHAGGFGAFGATYCLWLLVCYGETMRLRRYTRLAEDRVACGDYMFFCFAMRVGLAPLGATYCLWWDRYSCVAI